MAKIRWTGGATSTTDLWTLTLGGTWEVDDIVNLTIGNKTLAVTSGSTATATILTNITTAWNASTEPEFAEYTAAVTTSTAMTFTADTAGIPGTISVATTEANGGAADNQTVSITNTTAGTGPNNADNAKNYSSATVPTTGDELDVSNSSTSILYGLNGLSGATLARYTRAQSFTGAIGLPKTNANGYAEYRNDYLKINATLAEIGTGTGSGPTREKYNTEAVATTMTVYATGGQSENGVEALLIIGTNITALETYGGSVAVAGYAGEVSTITTVRNTRATLRLGNGCTLTTVQQISGNMTAYCAATTFTCLGGTITINNGANAVTTINAQGGVVRYNGSATVTTVTGTGGIVDCSGDLSSRTFTTTTLSNGSRIIDPLRTIVYTNGVQPGTACKEIIFN